MNSAGNVRWRTRLPRPAIALEIDPLGRFVIHGHATGEIVRLDLFGPAPRRPGDTGAEARGEIRTTVTRTSTGSVRRPDWTVPAVQSDQQAETAVLAITDDPACVGLFTSPHRLQLFAAEGQKLGQGPEMTGVGRILRTAPGWLAAATDRQIVLYDLRRNTQRRLDVSLVELTHLAIKPDSFGLALVQERDRVGRVTPSGRWIWKHELRGPIEDLVIGTEGFAAVTTNDGELIVFDPTGAPTVLAMFDPLDPPLLVEAPEGSPPGIAWLTLARRMQVLRAHDLKGKVVWTRQLPFEGWSMVRLGRFGIIASADGRVMAYDGSGMVRHEGPASGNSNDQYSIDEKGEPLTISRRNVHLICGTLDGRVRWRAVGEEALGPFAAAPAGVAILMGRGLAWFKTGETPGP
jgi:hypothetical protein